MMAATYSPDDNKLRLYADSKLGEETYKRVKQAGFKWAPRQKLFVAPMWTPSREDLLIELAGTIDDEDTSLVQRAEERADRFETYSEKREAEANGARVAVESIANGIPMGQPILVGHHSERHARRNAEKIRRGMERAVKLWKTSKYWTDRAGGALAHAKYKELPAVRARRIKKLEKELRASLKSADANQRALKAWRTKSPTPYEWAVAILNRTYHVGDAYTQLVAVKDEPEDVKLKTVSIVRLKRCRSLLHNLRHYRRWIAHYENRLAYERAMLQESGGIPTDQVKPEKGGACKCWVGRGWMEIKKVNRVTVSVLDNWGNGGRDFLRTVPFDKLSAVLSKADFDRLKAGDAPDIVKTEASQAVARLEANAKRREQAAADESSTFEAMAKTLKSGGVKVVSAPQLFPTPPDVAERVIELAEIEDGMDILEPSAGTGRLLDPLFNAEGTARKGEGGRLVVNELVQSLASNLRCTYACADVHCGDFLEYNPEVPDLYDRIIMNPPFSDAADIKHVRHALDMLKEGGRLVAIVANGPRQQKELQPLATSWEDLPSGTFDGTGVRAALIVIDK